MTPLGTNKINNGIKDLIDRYPVIRPRYRKGVMQRLKGLPENQQYNTSQVWRVCTDQTALNDQNKVIRKAFLNMLVELCPRARFDDDVKALLAEFTEHELNPA